jgi:hypothetical protein
MLSCGVAGCDIQRHVCDLILWEKAMIAKPAWQNTVIFLVYLLAQVFHPNVWGQSNERFGEICLSSLSTEVSLCMRV